MSDRSELKKLADEAIVFAGLNGEISYAQELFIAAATPSAVLALIAEVEALRKDAERYRWLRDTATGPWMRALDLYARRDKRMDAAIDEEMNRRAKP